MKRQKSRRPVRPRRSGTPWAWLAMVGVLLATPADAGDAQTVIKGIDVVGVPAAQVSEVLRWLGVKEGTQVPYARLESAVVTPAQARLERTGRFEQVSVRPTTFIGGDEDGATYLSVSVIARHGAPKAHAAPKGQHVLPDPVRSFFEERVRGLGAFRDTLYPMDQDRLEELAERHEPELAAALRDAADPEVRRQAAQAIAFLPDSRAARERLEASLLDSDAGVRRDVARALHPLVERQVGREAIPLEPYLALVTFPEPSDRLSAAGLLIRLASRPQHRQPILRAAGAPLLAMAQRKHPGERTLALEALQVLKQAPAPESWDTYRDWYEKTTAQRFSP